MNCPVSICEKTGSKGSKMLYRLAVLFFCLLTLPACFRQTGRKQPVGGSLGCFAARMLSEISNADRDVRPFKGLGHIRVLYGKTRLSGRAAWIADLDSGRLRFEVLDPGGRPVVRLIANRSSLFFSWYENGCFKTRTLGGRSLEPLVHIPINIEEFIFFLSGRIPIGQYDYFFAEKPDDADRCVVVLKKRWRGVVEKIGFIPANRKVTRVEFYGGIFGGVGGWVGGRFWAGIFSAKGIGSAPGFSGVVFSRGDVRVRIDIDRQWHDVRIADDAFKPETAGP